MKAGSNRPHCGMPHICAGTKEYTLPHIGCHLDVCSSISVFVSSGLLLLVGKTPGPSLTQCVPSYCIMMTAGRSIASRPRQVVWSLVPADLVPAVLGLVMIFFGGHYVTTIAAVESFRMVGWRTLRDSWTIVRLNYRKAKLGLRQDRLQRLKKGHTSPEQEFHEKIRIILKSVDPERLSQALSSLWVWSACACPRLLPWPPPCQRQLCPSQGDV